MSEKITIKLQNKRLVAFISKILNEIYIENTIDIKVKNDSMGFPLTEFVIQLENITWDDLDKYDLEIWPIKKD